MPIEFNCPYCTATVRVSDDAAGKVGRCPKCGSRIRIPVVEAPPTARSTAEPEPPSTDEFPVVAQPAAGGPTGQGPVVPTAAPTTSTSLPDQLPVIRESAQSGAAAAYLRERRKRKSAAWRQLLWPAVLASVLVAAIVFYQRIDRPSFEGQLVGIRLDPQGALLTEFSPRGLKAADPFWSELLASLKSSPVELRSNLLTVQVDGKEKATSILLRPGPESDFVRVAILEIPSVARFVAENQSALDRERLQELQLALDGMASDWRVQSGEPSELFSEFRDQLVLNAHRGGLGRICEAVVGDVRYPCVHQDQEGRLVFLVPRGTKRFEVHERIDLDQPHFPSPLRIGVDVSEKLRAPEEHPVAPTTVGSKSPSAEENRPQSASNPDSAEPVPVLERD